MTVSFEDVDLRFPVLCRSQGLVRVKLTHDELTTCNTLGLKNGWYRGMTVIDSRGKAVKVKDAHKLYGVGLFWGYNIFLNQRIKVELELSGQPFSVSVNDVRDMALESFRDWHGWTARGDFAELQDKVRKAQMLRELIDVLKG